MEVIEKILFDLNNALDEVDQNFNHIDAVHNIQAIVEGEVDDGELEIFSNFLFSSSNPPSLLHYVNKSVFNKDRDAVKARTDALKLLSFFAKSKGPAIANYAEFTVLSLLEFFKREDSSEAKSAALGAIKNILRPHLLIMDRSESVEFKPNPIFSDTTTIDKLYRSLIEEIKYSKKKSTGVICEILKTLGLIIGVYPSSPTTINHQAEVVDLCFDFLNSNFSGKSKEPDLSVIAGTFSCLDRTIYHFEEKCLNNSELWKYLLQATQTVQTASRYAAAAKALRFIKNHASLFQNIIGINAAETYRVLQIALNNIKDATKKHTADAINAVMEQMGAFGSANNKPHANFLATVDQLQESLMEKVTRCLEISSSKEGDTNRSFDSIISPEGANVALLGLIGLAPATMALKLPNGASKIESIVKSLLLTANSLKRVHQLKSTTISDVPVLIGNSQSILYQKCLFFTAISSFLFTIFNLSKDNSEISILINLLAMPDFQLFLDEFATISVIGYSSLWRKSQRIISLGLFKLTAIGILWGERLTLNVLGLSNEKIQEGKKILEEVLKTIHKTALLRAVARKETSETIGPDSVRLSAYTGEVEDRLIYVYSTFWLEFINPIHKPTRLALTSCFGFDALDRISIRIVDYFVTYLLELITSLDLSFSIVEELSGIDSDINCIPINMVDQDIAINAFDLFYSVFSKQSSKIISSHNSHLLSKLIDLSRANPLISGFYRGISFLLEAPVTEENEQKLISEYLLDVEEMISSSRGEFKGELLSSALNMVLTCPIQFLNVKQLIPSLEMSLVNSVAIDKAVSIMNDLFIKDPNGFLSKAQMLLPLLEIYISGQSLQSLTKDKLTGESALSKDTLHNILDFLGRLGSSNQWILKPPVDHVQDSLAWTDSPGLILDLHISYASKGSQYSVILDKIVCFVINVGQRYIASGNEQAITTCAECLHSLIQYIVGKISTLPGPHKANSIIILSKSLPMLILLSAQSLPAQMLLGKLFNQTIHWLSASQDLEASGLVDALFDALCNPRSDNSLRDLCCSSIEEIFKWSFQADSIHLSGPIQLLSKVIVQLSHPSLEYRMAAVQVLLKLYRHFREHPNLIGKFILQITHLLLKNLLYDTLPNQRKDIEMVVTKFEEIIARSVSNSSITPSLFSYDESRIFPKSMDEFLVWLFDSGISSESKYFRRSCMRCFYSLSQCADGMTESISAGSDKPRDFVWKNWAKAKNIKTNNPDGRMVFDAINALITDKLILKPLEAYLASQNVLEWLSRFNTILDIYSWLFTVEILNIEDLIGNSSNCMVFPMIHAFLLNISSMPPESADIFKRIMIFVSSVINSCKTGRRSTDSEVRALISSTGVLSEDFCKSAIRFGLVRGNRNDHSDYLAFLKVFIRDISLLDSTNNLWLAPFRSIFQISFPQVLRSTDSSLAQSVLFLISFGKEIIPELFNPPSGIDLRMISKDLIERACYVASQETLFPSCKDYCTICIRWGLYFGMGIDDSSPFPDSSLVSYMSLLMDPLSGSVIMSHFEDVLVEQMLDKSSSVSVLKRKNFECLYRSLENSSNLEAIATSLFNEISSQLASDSLSDNCKEIASTLLKWISEFGYNGLSKPLLSVVLTLNAQLLLDDPQYCDYGLRMFVTKQFKLAFSQLKQIDTPSICTCLNWLPFILEGTTKSAPRPMTNTTLDSDTSEIIDCLENLVAIKFPLESSSLSSNLEKGKEYMQLLTAYLDAIKSCGNPNLFSPLLSSLREGRAHRYFQSFENTLSSIAKLISEDDSDLVAVKVVFNFCMSVILDEYQEQVLKDIFFEGLFVKVLKSLCSSSLVKLFASSNTFQFSFSSLNTMKPGDSMIKTLVDIVQIEKLKLSNVEVYMQKVSFRILEILYDYCSLTDIKGTLTQAFVGPSVVSTGKELTVGLCKVALKITHNQKASLSEDIGLHMELISAAYNCLVVLVAKTQTEEQFYDNFLFKEKAGENLWKQIVCEHFLPQNWIHMIVSPAGGHFETITLGTEQNSASFAYFPVSRSQMLSRVARSSSIRGGLLSQFVHSSMLSQGSVTALTQSMKARDPRKNSVNSQTIQKGDYTLSQYRLEGAVDSDDLADESRDESAGNSAATAIGWDDQLVYLEMNHLNKIPAMGVLIRVIKRMDTLFGASKWNDSLVPKWLQELSNRLADPSSPKALRLFILRLFMNQPVASIIKRWIPELISGILYSVEQDLCSIEPPSQKYGYFLRDLVLLLCDEWKMELPGVIHDKASRLLTFLIDHLFDSDPDIEKENFLSIVALFKVWLSGDPSDAAGIDINLQNLIVQANSAKLKTGGQHGSTLSEGMIAVRARLYCLEIISTLIRLKYPILRKSHPSSAVTSLLVDFIKSSIQYERNEVVEAASSLAGLIILSCKDYSSSGVIASLNAEEFSSMVFSSISSWIHKKDGVSQYISSLHAIVLNAPMFFQREHILKVMHWFPKMKTKTKFKYLDILLKCEAGFDLCPRKALMSNLCDVSTVAFGRGAAMLQLPVVQIYTILLLTKNVSLLDPQELYQILNDIIGSSETEGLKLCLSQKAAVQTRYAAYQFLFQLFRCKEELNVLKIDRGGADKIGISKLGKSLTQLIFKGFLDSDSSESLESLNEFDANAERSFNPIDDKNYHSSSYWEPSNGSRVSIRSMVGGFIHREFGLGSTIEERLIHLVTKLFDPSSAEWLRYASYLMISAVLESSDSTRLVFSQNLGDPSSYSLVDVKSLSQGFTLGGHVSKSTPMFALEKTTKTLTQILSQSQANLQAIGSLASLLTSANIQATQVFKEKSQHFGSGVIKGTQQYSWTQTQREIEPRKTQSAAGGNLTGLDNLRKLGWTQTQKTQKSQNTSNAPGKAELHRFDPVSIEKQVTVQKSSVRFSADREGGGGAAAGTAVAGGSGSQSIPKKKFANLAKIHASSSLKKQEKQQKKKQVTFCRQYKEAELPDISITLFDLFKPIQSMCLCDDRAASTVLVAICEMLLGDPKLSDSSPSVISRISTFAPRLMIGISNAVATSQGKGIGSTCAATLLSVLNICFLQVIKYSPGTLDTIATQIVDDSIVADLSINSGNYYCGLAYLENKLHANNLRALSVSSANQREKNSAETTGNSKRKKLSAKESRASASLKKSSSELGDLIDDQDFESSATPAAAATPAATAAAAAAVGEAGLGASTYDMESEKAAANMQLVRIYESLKEQDIVSGISLQLSLEGENAAESKLALEAEISGDYEKALEIYASILEDMPPPFELQRKRRLDDKSSENTQLLSTLWTERSMNCLRTLGKWDDLYDKSNSYYESARNAIVRNRILPQQMSALLMTSVRIKDPNDAAVNRLQMFLEAGLTGEMELEYKDDGSSVAPSVRECLENSCSLDLASSYVVLQDWSRVRYYADNAHWQFINRWKALHPCAFKARQELLGQLQRIVELRDVASLELGKLISKEDKSQQLVRLWSSSEPSMQDSLVHWFNLSATRFAALNGKANGELTPIACIHLARQHVRTALAALNQGIISVVKPLMETNSILRRSVFGKATILTMQEVQVVIQYHKSSILRGNISAEEENSMISKTLNMLKKKQQLLEETAGFAADGGSSVDWLEKSLWLEKVHIHLLNANWLSFMANHEEKRNLSPASKEEVGRKRVDALTLYLQCVGLLNDPSERGRRSLDDMVNYQSLCYSTLARHCDALLASAEAKGSTLQPKNLEPVLVLQSKAFKEKGNASSLTAKTSVQVVLAQQVLLSYMKSLHFGGSYARERIMHLVRVIHRYKSHLQELFLQHLETIPAWMFLRFSAQLMGGLDLPEGEIIAPILEKVALAYPGSLVYSFRITSENFGQKGKRLSGRLSRLLEDRGVDCLIEALGGLTHPELRWNDNLKGLDVLLKQLELMSKEKSKDKAAAMAELTSELCSFLDKFRSDVLSTSWQRVGKKCGRYNIKWAVKMKAKFDSIVGPKNEKVISSSRGVMEKLMELVDMDTMEFSGGRVDLAQFSDWLAEFDSAQYRIEIPGQYSRYLDSIPRVETHEYISSVDCKLLVMTSIRRPKRITFHGNAGGEFMFLVKGGEDLRNDERIEQLFSLMNHVIDKRLQRTGFEDQYNAPSVDELLLLGPTLSSTLSTPPALNQKTLHGLSARTYNVVPMSSRVGVLEWVKNTVPVASIILQEMANDRAFKAENPDAFPSSSEVSLAGLRAFKVRADWVGGSGGVDDYHRVYRKSEAEAVEIFRQVTSSVPTDFLRRRFLRIAMSPEAFYTMRGEYARSLAISSVFGYILGLGDRHLENLLIDTRTGAVVPIDFGICFGMGASMLPVPEFFPFRLTSQFRDVLQPLEGAGLLRQYMIKAMQLLRASASDGVIENALEVYISDPVMDWLRGIGSKDKDEIASLRASMERSSEDSDGVGGGPAGGGTGSGGGGGGGSGSGSGSGSGKSGWEPTRRVQMAVRKLRGADPIALLLEDLALNANVQRRKSLSYLEQIVQSSRKLCPRPRVAGGRGGETSNPLTSLSLSLLTAGADADSADESLLPVSEQVDLLIAMATNPNVLVRQWFGLQMWM